MKRLSFFMLVLIVFGYAADAQEIIPKKVITGPVPLPVAQPVTMVFNADRNFYLTIGGRSYGKVSKSEGKRVSLRLGTHRIRFEEAESTGEYIVRTVNVTAQTKNNTSYRISFTQNLE